MKKMGVCSDCQSAQPIRLCSDGWRLEEHTLIGFGRCTGSNQVPEFLIDNPKENQKIYEQEMFGED